MMGGLDGGRRLMEREVLKPRNLGWTLRRFGTYFSHEWLPFTIALVFIVAATWTQVVSPDLFGQAVDCFIFPTPNSVCWYSDLAPNAPVEAKLAGLGSLVLALSGLFVLGAVLSGLAFYAMRLAGENVLRAIRIDLFRKMQNQTVGYYAENEVGNLMSRVTSDSDTIQQVFGFGLMSVLSGVLLVGWITIRMFQTNAVYALVTLAVVPFMAFATVYFSTQARRAYRTSRQEMGTVNADLQESIAGVREVQAFNREEESIDNFRRVNAANRDANVRAATFTSALTPVLEALGFVGIALVVIVGGLAVLRGEMLAGTVITLGTVTVFLNYVQRFNQPIQQIAILWTNIQSAIAGGERIFGLLEEPITIVDAPDAQVMPPITGRVVFDDVRAEYKAGQPVLKGVSFTAEPGQTVAIVGPTGAGKTTIINLIPRFYDVTGGSVRIDDVDVRTVTQASLRAQIGIVLQDTFLFSDTVMNNIRYGRMDASDEDVVGAAKLVSAHDFIERLPEGYQTVLGERGAGLSQGQRQLIAIARAALGSPRILILDEATSSVDTRTERLIQQAFEHLLEGRTSFVIAHRLSTIRSADLVLMLRAGEIIERGTHETLLAQRGAYYELYMSQFRHEDTADANGTHGTHPVNGTPRLAAQPSGD